MAVFDESLFGMVPDRLPRRSKRRWPATSAGIQPPTVPSYIRLGSWIGGDRDGNPNVTAPITREALDVQADHVLRALTDATERTRGDPDPRRAEHAALGRVAHRGRPGRRPAPGPDRTALTSSENEPHRDYLLFVAARLRRDAEPARRPGLPQRRRVPRRPAPRAVLAGRRPVRCASPTASVQDLLWQVETFGFHLAELEVRQHSGLHTAALAAYLGDDARNAEVLDQVAREGVGEPITPLDDMSREVLATIRAIAALQHRWGVRACHRYVVSFTSRASDLVAVRALARIAVGDGALRRSTWSRCSRPRRTSRTPSRCSRSG